MKKQKTELRRLERFPFYDFTGIETHLQNMAARGWLLKERGNTFWTYEKIPPQELTFAVSYLPDWSEFDPQPTDGQQLYYELCESAGWVLVATWNKMQIFCTSNPNPVPLETDPQTRLETIEKAMNRSLLPNLFVMLLLIGVQFWNFGNQIANNPMHALSNSVTVMMPLLFALLLAVHLLEALPYFLWLSRSRRTVAEGGVLPPSQRPFRILSNTLLAAAIVCFIPMISGNELGLGGWIRTMILVFIPIFGVTWLAVCIKEDLKEQKVSRRKNQIITISTAVIGTVAAMALILYITVMGLISGLFQLGDEGIVQTVEIPLSQGGVYKWDMYRDTLPLYAEDLTDVDYDLYSYENRRSQTFLAALQEVRQDAPPHRDATDRNVPELRYEIFETPFSAVFRYVLHHALNDEFITDFEQDEWREVDASAWNCTQAWQRYSMGEPGRRYLLADSETGTLIDIYFYWNPTEEQIRIAGEKLFS